MSTPQPFYGMTLKVIPDSDERWENVEPLTVLGDNNVAYVRESEWPVIRAAIIKATKLDPR